MKLADIVIGQFYAMKVSGAVTIVRIDGEVEQLAYGTRASMFKAPRRMRKFYGINMRTGRAITAISPARVRFAVDADKAALWILKHGNKGAINA